MNHERDPLAVCRRLYAKIISIRVPGHTARVEAAFAQVPREAFLGPPPWSIGTGDAANWHDISEPAALYQDVLVAMNKAKGINNGQPSLHARCISALRLRASDDVLHVGAGAGYYTAILARLAASVVGYEIEPDLAKRAATNLLPWPNARICPDTAVGRPLPPVDAIYVSAGVTAPDPHWLDALRPGGRLLFPLTGDERLGGMLLVTRRARGFAAAILCECGFIDCVGMRDPVTARRLTAVFRAGGAERVRSLTRSAPHGATLWFRGDGWYLSTRPV